MKIKRLNLRSLNLKNGILLLVVFTLVFSSVGKSVQAAVGDPVPTVEEVVPELDYMAFQSESDQNLMIGETTNIKVILFDEEDDPFSGGISAYISDAEGDVVAYYSVNGNNGYYTVSNVTLDYEGEYTLHIYDSDWNYANGQITVTKPLITISGEIAKNTKSQITGKLTDVEGKALARKTVTVDGTEIGLSSSQNYTTAYDGTFSFWITPTEMGELKFLYSGHEIGKLEVKPPYSHDGRIGGDSRSNVELSISVAQEGWTRADTVILTRDDNLADSLTAVPLSRRYNAPILMNPKDHLDDQIGEEIMVLEATHVMIIGGEEAISKDIETQLLNWGYSVERIAGEDRYDTAAKIASKFGSSETVYLAYGHGEPDALVASSFAAIKSIPILLTDKLVIPEATQKELERLAPSEVVILGGDEVVDPKVETELVKNYLVDRWGGDDRYETEWAILRNLFVNESKLYFSSALVSPKDVSSGKPFGDALLAASLAAKTNGVVINIPSKNLPKAIEYFLLYNRGYISETRIVGNTTAITGNLEKQIEQLLTR